jgi:hypothetical protein
MVRCGSSNCRMFWWAIRQMIRLFGTSLPPQELLAGYKGQAQAE